MILNNRVNCTYLTNIVSSHLMEMSFYLLRTVNIINYNANEARKET